mmetsp:Transcript_95957/g.293505  ORF Transcript_95957/g.293505 Transcript_95957/m.293505 type:complete len:435 (+) Transcript_95957:787-2091(+)
MAPKSGLGAIGVQCQQRVQHFLLEAIIGHEIRVKRFPLLRHELGGHLDLHLLLLRPGSRAFWPHPEHLRGLVRHVLEVLGERRLVAHLAGLELPRHPGATPHECEVVLRWAPAQRPIHALVVWPFDGIRRQRAQPLAGCRHFAFEVQRLGVREGDPLRNQDPIRSQVAHVAKIILRDLDRQGGLQQPAGIQFEQLHRLLVHRRAQPVRPRGRVHGVRHLREQLGVEALDLLLIPDLEEELATVVPCRHLNLLLQDDLHHLVVLIQSTGGVERLGQPSWAHLVQQLLVPREFHAVEHAGRFLFVVRGDLVNGDPIPRRDLLRQLFLAPLPARIRLLVIEVHLRDRLLLDIGWLVDLFAKLLARQRGADPTDLGPCALDELVIQAAVSQLELDNDGPGGQPLLRCLGLQVLPFADDDAALVATSDDLPILGHCELA